MSRRNPRSDKVIIFDGDDHAVMSEARTLASVAERRLNEAKEQRVREAAANRRLGDDLPDLSDLEEALEKARADYSEIVRKAAERAEEVTVRAIPRRAFLDLVEKHPPRELEVDGEKQIHPEDAWCGLNSETFGRDLLLFDQNGRTSFEVDPPFADAREREAYIDDDLDEGEFTKLWIAALGCNRSVDNPKTDRFYLDSPGTSPKS